MHHVALIVNTFLFKVNRVSTKLQAKINVTSMTLVIR